MDFGLNLGDQGSDAFDECPDLASCLEPIPESHGLIFSGKQSVCQSDPGWLMPSHWLAVGERPSVRSKQIAHGNAQRVGKLGDRRDGRAPLPPLDTADVVPVNPGFQAQLFLGNPALRSGGSDGFAQSD